MFPPNTNLASGSTKARKPSFRKDRACGPCAVKFPSSPLSPAEGRIHRDSF